CREAAGVARAPRAAVTVNGVEPPQQDLERGGLDLVEAEIEADLGVHVLVEAAVVTQSPAARGEIVVARQHGAAVAHGGQVLRRVEQERPGHAAGPPRAAGAGAPPRPGASL